jgi:hypothetical protein
MGKLLFNYCVIVLLAKHADRSHTITATWHTFRTAGSEANLFFPEYFSGCAGNRAFDSPLPRLSRASSIRRHCIAERD